jgi:hypothetical protein
MPLEGELTQADHDALLHVGISLPVGVHFKNSSVERSTVDYSVPDLFVLCLTAVANNPALSTNERTSTLRISSIELLAEFLTRRHRNVLGTGYSWGRVDYAPRTFDPRKIVLNPNPFIKEVKFKPEQEIRIVWTPADTSPELLTDCPEISGLVSRI